MNESKTTSDYEPFINKRTKEILGDEWYLFDLQEKVMACMQAEREWQEARSKGVNAFLEKAGVTP